MYLIPICLETATLSMVNSYVLYTMYANEQTSLSPYVCILYV